MICHKIGSPPISTIGFGFTFVSSLILVPNPPAKITTFIYILLFFNLSNNMCIIKLSVVQVPIFVKKQANILYKLYKRSYIIKKHNRRRDDINWRRRDLYTQ